MRSLAGHQLEMANNSDNGAGEKANSGPPSKPMLDLGMIKAFLAGVVLANLNKGVLLGFVAGAIGGVYLQQNAAGIPDVKETWRELIRRWNSSRK